jgi:hypothetical protein
MVANRSADSQIMMKDYISNQKQWEAQQVKSAPETPSGPEDEERELTAENAESEGLLPVTYLR